MDVALFHRKYRIDEVCRDFEESRYEETPPSMLSFVDRVPIEDRDETLRELMAIDMELRWEDSGDIPVAEYVAKWPGFASMIEQVYSEVIQLAATRELGEPGSVSPRIDAGEGNTQRRLGDFRIVREIGRGGMGRVYEAIQESLRRPVALKVLPPSSWLHESNLERFQREARAIARLHHSHIVEIFGSGEANGTSYFAMQLVDGLSLDKLILFNRKPQACAPTSGRVSSPYDATVIESPTPEDAAAAQPDVATLASAWAGTKVSPRVGERGDDLNSDNLLVDAHALNDAHALRLNEVGERCTFAARIGHEIADALHYAHSQGVLHRDVKPSNILIDEQGTSWLTDFGLAKLVTGNQDGTLTEQGDVLGTLRYMAPENLRGSADARSDLFSLGLTLLELVTLQPAYETAERDQLLQQRLHGDAPQIGAVDAAVPRDLVTILRKAIEVDPAGRYQTAGELADDLQRFLRDEPIHARRVSSGERLTRWARRNKRLAALLVTVGCLVTLIAISSTIAAVYFQGLNKTLETTVGRLTKTTDELKVERNKARDSADDAVATRQASQGIVADMQTERGLLAAEQGDAAGSMLWFATASTQTPHDLKRQQANRLRARNAMNQTVLPVASLRFAKPGAVKRLEFQPCPDRDESLNRTPQARAFRAEPGTDAAAENGRGVVEKEDVQDAVAAEKEKAKEDKENAHACGLRLNELLLTVAGTRVEIWDWRTEQVLPWTNSENGFTDACWLPDGRHVAIGLKTGEVQVRSVPAGEVTQTFQSKGSIESLTCSADGQLLALSSDVVQVWKISQDSMDSQKPVLEHELAHPKKVYSLRFNRSGDRLMTACRDNLVRVFAIGGPDQPAPLIDPVAHVRDVGIGVEISPEFQSDRVLVIVSPKVGGGSQIACIDASTGAAINGRLPFAVPVVGRLSVSRDGEWLAAATAVTCELSPSQGERLSLKHPHQVHDVAFGPGGALLTACFDWHAYLRPSPTSQATPTKIPQLRPAERCVFSEDGSFIAIADSTAVRVWHRPVTNDMQLAAPGWERAQWRPRPSFDGELATGGRWHAIANAAHTLNEVSVLKVKTGQAAGPSIRLDNIVDSTLCAERRSVAKQRLVAVVSQKDKAGILSFYDVATGQLHQPPIEFPARPISVAARPGQPQVAVLCENGTLLVFEIHEGRRLHELTHSKWPWGHPFHARFPRVTWSPDGAALITVTTGGEVFVRDAETGRERFPPIQLRLKGGVCTASDISSDSRLLVTAITGENAVQVWDLQTGEPRCPPIPHPGDFWGLYAVQFSPDGKLVLSANKDGRARVWDWKKGTLVCPPLEHPDEVFDAAFSSDGQHSLTVDRTGTVSVWELTTGKHIAAPIHYPTPDNGRLKTIFTVTVVGDRAILGAPNFPMLDLSKLLSEPNLSTESLQTLAELATARRILLGEASSLTAEEWQQQWSDFKQRPAAESQ